MAEAKRRGKHLGSPFKLSKRRALTAHKMIARDGMDIGDVANLWKVAPITVARALRRHGLEGQ